MNPTTVPPAAPDDRARFYAADAAWYVKQLPLEHFMESTAQATQRKVTLESFDVIAAERPEVQCFNELLVQYPAAGQKHPARVVPDNFIVLHPTPLGSLTSFAVELQPARPYFVLEYVSKHNPRKDYEDNLVRYEQSLRVPYYLVFYPDNEELTLFRLVGGKYQTVHANAAGRYAVPELELEVALLDGWVRFWFRGALVPLPAELQARFRAEREARAAAERGRDAAERGRAVAERERDAEKAARESLEAELARLRAQLGGQPG